MLKVLVALVPGIAAYVWFFGAATLVQIALASAAALAGEAAMLRLRGKPVGLFLADGSALVTAWLIALTFPPSPSSSPSTSTAASARIPSTRRWSPSPSPSSPFRR